jgi:hypothetical protein
MKNQKKYKEKRRQPRTKKSIHFKLKTGDSTITTESINLSCIGAYCRVNKHIPYMTNLKIIIALPSGNQEDGIEYVECNGVVARVEKALTDNNGGNIHNIAIFFNEIKDSAKEKIARFIKKHGRDS